MWIKDETPKICGIQSRLVSLKFIRGLKIFQRINQVSNTSFIIYHDFLIGYSNSVLLHGHRSEPDVGAQLLRDLLLESRVGIETMRSQFEKCKNFSPVINWNLWITMQHVKWKISLRRPLSLSPPSSEDGWCTILIACGLSSRTPSMGQAALATLDITRSQCHCVTQLFTIIYSSERSSCSRPARLRTRTTSSCSPRQPTRLPSWCGAFRSRIQTSL